MKIKILFICVIILLLCVGLFFILYPTIMDKDNMKKQGEILTAIENGETEITVSIASETIEHDYYSINEATPLPETSIPSDDITSVSGIGIIEIISIDLKLPVVEGVESAKLKVAPGHVSESASIGAVGNCIIAGHRNYRYGEMFNRLDEVKVGDEITFTTVDGTAYTYLVYGITVIKPGDKKLFEYKAGQTKLTLLTCTPIRKATHRLLILANLIE